MSVFFMSHDRTLHFPTTFAELKEFLATPAAQFLGVLVVSGKPHGAFYTYDSDKGTYRLDQQASLVRALPSDFPAELGFDENNRNHIPVRDAAGGVKRFICVDYADLTKGYGAGENYSKDFVDHYLTPSREEE